MNIFDVTSEEQEEISLIKVADADQELYTVEAIKVFTDNVVELVDLSVEEKSHKVFGKIGALNLIKGLQKAIDLGWLK